MSTRSYKFGRKANTESVPEHKIYSKVNFRGEESTFSYGGYTVQVQRQVYSDEEDYEDDLAQGMTSMNPTDFQYGYHGQYDEDEDEE